MRTPFSSFLAAAAVVFCGVSVSHAVPPGAATPYMFVGRVMDSSHAGFDTNRVCTIAALSASGEALVQTRTFFRGNTRNNYALRVPVATAEAEGFALQGDILFVTATDDKEKVWEGVIPDSLCGEPGGVREVDIVLGEDKDGDGIDDDLFAQLLAQWEASPHWKPGVEFDPNDDHDGDGVSTLDEALAGTDSFDETDVFAITSFTATNGVSVEFPTSAGRVYELQTATGLSEADWGPTSPAATVATPSNARGGKATLYLLPSTNSPVFFRIRVE